MKTIKIEIEVPTGNYCTGCPCSIMLPHPDKTHYWRHGCAMLHTVCKSEGEYDERGIKHKDCPARKINDNC